MKSMKAWRSAAVAAISAVSALSLAPAATADTFTPQNDAPTVTITSTPMSMQPANPRSTDDYIISATVKSQGTVSNLKTVTMCLYKSSEASDCSTPDAKTNFKMVWTESTNSFAKTGSNNYTDAGSTSDYGDGTGLVLDIDFEFKVSNAMLAGSDWTVTIVAIDDQDQSSLNSIDPDSYDEVTGLIVDYFGAVTVQRAGQGFDPLAVAGTDTILGIPTGSFLANGVSELYIEATDFTYLTNTIYLDASTTDPAMLPAGYAALMCESAGSTSGSVNLYSFPSTFHTGLFATGTGETADASLTHDCTLIFGGGAPVANVEYENTVTISIGQGI